MDEGSDIFCNLRYSGVPRKLFIADNDDDDDNDNNDDDDNSFDNIHAITCIHNTDDKRTSHDSTHKNRHLSFIMKILRSRNGHNGHTHIRLLS